jgi:hypothetical protein
MAHDQTMAVRVTSDTLARLCDALLSDPAGIGPEAYEHLMALCDFVGATKPSAGDLRIANGRIYEAPQPQEVTHAGTD